MGISQELYGLAWRMNLVMKLCTSHCNFTKVQVLDIKVMFNTQKRVVGLLAVPTQEAIQYTPPSYVNLSAFTETNITVGSGQWALPATLSIPKGTGPFSAVVLVHGSGPNDRDETVRSQ